MTTTLTNNAPVATQLGEANFMRAPVSCIISAEQCNCFVQVAAYALTFFIALALALTLVGIPFILKGVSEYSRQSNEPQYLAAQRQVTELREQAAQRQVTELREQNANTDDLLNAEIRKCGTLQAEVTRLKDAAYQTGIRVEALQATVADLTRQNTNFGLAVGNHAVDIAAKDAQIAALQAEVENLQHLPATQAMQIAMHAGIGHLHEQAIAALEQELAQLQSAYKVQTEQLKAVISNDKQPVGAGVHYNSGR